MTLHQSSPSMPADKSTISATRKAIGLGLTIILGTGVAYAAYLTMTLSPVAEVRPLSRPSITKKSPPKQITTPQIPQVPPMPRALTQSQPVIQPKIVDACSAFKDKLPADYVVYAGGSYSGRKLGHQIDQSGHEATGFEVSVNIPDQKVVLALGAYEPSVWNIRKGENTHIAGVFVSGYHRQKITGLDATIPVLNSSYEDRTPCNYFYITNENVRSADEKIRQVLGKSAESYYLAANGQVIIGEPLGRREPGLETNYPLAGKAGLDALVAEGALRPAGKDALKKFYEEKRIAEGLPILKVVGGSSDSQDIVERPHTLYTYMVMKPMTFPAGLFGAHAVTFIVQHGVPRPSGNPGHSAVYDMNTLTCSGALCR